MSTVGAIIDRLYRTWLYPPDMAPAEASLDGAINSTATTLVFKDFVIPEDEDLLHTGARIEIGSEIIRLGTYTEGTQTAINCVRGFLGSTAASHADGDTITLAPPFPRQSVFEAVADNIITLYPSLYQVKVAEVVSSGHIAPLEDALAVEVVEAWTSSFHSDQAIDARIVDYHPGVGGRALITNLITGDLWVRYRTRMGDAAAEADTLASLGVEARWVNIVMAGAAADLYAGRDLPKTHVEWVTSLVEAENIPVGTRSSLARQLAAYREFLLENAKREMRAEYRAQTHMRSATQVRVRSPFG